MIIENTEIISTSSDSVSVKPENSTEIERKTQEIIENSEPISTSSDSLSVKPENSTEVGLKTQEITTPSSEISSVSLKVAEEQEKPQEMDIEKQEIPSISDSEPISTSSDSLPVKLENSTEVGLKTQEITTSSSINSEMEIEKEDDDDEEEDDEDEEKIEEKPIPVSDDFNAHTLKAPCKHFKQNNVFVDTEDSDWSVLAIDFERKRNHDPWYQIFCNSSILTPENDKIKKIEQLVEKESKNRTTTLIPLTPQSTLEDASSTKIKDLDEDGLQKDGIKIWNKRVKKLQKPANEEDDDEDDEDDDDEVLPDNLIFQSDLQKVFMNCICSYKDVMFPYLEQSNSDSLISSTVFHIAQHLLKTKRYQWHNSKRKEFRDNDYYVKDKTLTSPFICMVVPFRSSAFEIVKLLSALLPKLKNVRRNEAFDLTFGEAAASIDEEQHKFIKSLKKPKEVEEKPKEVEEKSKKPRKNGKPAWYNEIFNGNIDDNFVLGLALHNGQLEIMSPFEKSDILIGTPLGFHNETYKDKNFTDLLSSIEILVVDQMDTMEMQNPVNLMEILQKFNLPPKKVDVSFISDVRDYYIHEKQKYFRQNILISRCQLPIANSFFNNFALCCNLQGKVVFQRSESGILHVLNATESEIPLVFERFPCAKPEELEDSRFKYFKEKIFPRVRQSSNIFIIVVPSYLEFVRIRNFLNEEKVQFRSLTEYTENKKKMVEGMNSGDSILVMTERFFYFQCPKLRELKTLEQFIFYSPPVLPQFFRSIVDKAGMVATTQAQAKNAKKGKKKNQKGIKKQKKKEDDDDEDIEVEEGIDVNAHKDPPKVTTIFSFFDAMKLERIVGSSRARAMLTTPDSQVFMFNNHKQKINQ